MKKRKLTAEEKVRILCGDRPEEGKQYALTGKPGDPCIANGNTWKESEVKNESATG